MFLRLGEGWRVIEGGCRMRRCAQEYACILGGAALASVGIVMSDTLYCIE